MTYLHITGVDPGLVHTGIVHLLIGTDTKTISERHAVISGTANKLEAVAEMIGRANVASEHVFVEKYQPRAVLSSDARMTKLQTLIQAEIPKAKLILNTGVKQVVRRPLMELLEVWEFSTRTHHQDLRSAARILLYGMLKNPQLNTILADIVRDHIEGRTWNVDH